MRSLLPRPRRLAEKMWPSFSAPIAFSPHDVTCNIICDFQTRSNWLLDPTYCCPHGMFEKWHYLASAMTSKPTCKQRRRRRWRTVWPPRSRTDPYSERRENFDICAACHAGWNQKRRLGATTFPPPEWYTLRGQRPEHATSNPSEPPITPNYIKQMGTRCTSPGDPNALCSLRLSDHASLPDCRGLQHTRRVEKCELGTAIETRPSFARLPLLLRGRKPSVRGTFSSPTPCRCRQNAPLLALLGAHARPVRPAPAEEKSLERPARLRGPGASRSFAGPFRTLRASSRSTGSSRKRPLMAGYGPEQRVAQLRVAAARDGTRSPATEHHAAGAGGGRRWSEKKEEEEKKKKRSSPLPPFCLKGMIEVCGVCVK